MLYMSSPEYHRKYNRERYRRQRASYIEALGGKCVTCGATERLEIDHIDPQTKSFTVASKPTMSPRKVAIELQKCQLLCRSCHIAKTYKDKGQVNARLTHGTLSSYRYCHCDKCRAAQAAYMKAYYAKRRNLEGKRDLS